MRRFGPVFLLLLLLLPVAFVHAEGEAENLNLQGTWTFAGGKISPRGDYVNDNNSESRRELAVGKTLRIRLEEETAAVTLGLEWYAKPAEAIIERYDAAGTLLGSDTVSGAYISLTSLEKGTREIVIRSSSAALHIAETDVFGAGTLPEPYHAFQELPEKLDYLIIATHPDDDVLFLGGAAVYLSGAEGLTGTIVYMTKPAQHQRNTEALNGAWTMGIRYAPIFGSMKDVYVNSMEKLYTFVNREDTIKYLVELLRRYRPVLVFTHEPEGEYGHMEHILVSDAVYEAVQSAQDPNYNGGSLELYGTWQVQKLYWHDYEQAQSTLLFDADTPLSSFGGKTAYEICREAYKKHKSQQARPYAVHRYKEHANSFNFFGLTYSAVGEYGALREGIDPALFSDYVPPVATPTPMPSPAPTPTPTSGLSPVPATASTAAPLPTLTPAPTPVPAAPEAGKEPLLSTPALAAIALLLLLGGFFARLWQKKWRQC